MNPKHYLSCTLGLCLAAAAGAAVSDDTAGRPGEDLTPVGATATASADGSIPAWTGGEPQHSLSDGFPRNPVIDNDKPLFVITSDNYQQYAERLTEGHKQLFMHYKDYHMVVYPTRRTASYPEKVLVGTAANETQCRLVGTDQPEHCGLGFPFPNPHSGAEAIWNHKLRWRGEEVERYSNQFMVSSSRDWHQNRILEQVKYWYAPHVTESGPYDLLRYLAHVLAPPRIFDNYLLVQERTGTGDDARAAWVVLASLKSVRRAPELQYDIPYPDTDGAQYYDQFDMFSGALDHYTWTLVGKKEFYLPYNANRLAGNGVKYRDLIRPNHLNQDLPRYELHRYWIVDAMLKPGTHHVYTQRRYYLDEDSWNIEAVDNRVVKGQLRSFQEGHLIHFADTQVAVSAPQVIYDLARGSYFVTAAFNEDKAPNFDVHWTDDYFDPASLSRLATR